MIPIKILPKEKYTIHLVFKEKDTQVYNGTLNLKIICGNITAKEMIIPYTCNVQKSPLSIYPMKVEFPALPVNEKRNTFVQL